MAVLVNLKFFYELKFLANTINYYFHIYKLDNLFVGSKCLTHF